ncbi:transmembrane glycoprotein NMB isoform X2 [Astyanax mexicanus]|uniref:Transmembrane glycoprotein NMB isoform X2 n=1 Tax=Astyanax mexicanus TaxID=7994 RepID=A0A8T2MGS3_ASTMX|nr:transmembrane glycoprotein NMB isoform X2 [Astyanax mexicanus]
MLLLLVSACLLTVTDSKKTYGDMFPHKHKPPFPYPIPGWEPDTNPWDDGLYPPFPRLLSHRHGKPKVRLTSDSPAMNGSSITFSARLEYPPCQREDQSGNLLYDEPCEDANGQVQSAFMINWSSWLDDYGFGKCTDLKRCNVFPDGKPFPLHSDWRRRGYVYVWHTMGKNPVRETSLHILQGFYTVLYQSFLTSFPLSGQYFETCDGSSSSLTLNTTNWTFGAGVMEVMVYRKRERRKYSPLSTDNTVFFVTDKIPLAVNISQKEGVNISERNVFYKGFDIIFNVQVHDPSNYLKTADAVDFIWDFRDGNQLVTHSNVATHAYSALGNVTVKLIVEAAFRIQCPPPTPTPMHFTLPFTTAVATPPPPTQATTTKLETTNAPLVTTAPPTTAQRIPVTTPVPSTEPFPTDPEVNTSTDSGINSTSAEPTPPPALRHTHLTQSECFRYMHGTFEDEIIITEPRSVLFSAPPSKIVGVSAAKVTNSTVKFVVTCLGRIPTSACTTVADSTCRQVVSIMCDDVPPSAEGCQVSLKRTFQEPGTYCVNITLGVPGGLALATTTVTIGDSPEKGSGKSPRVAEVVLSSTAVLVVIFACIAFMVYKRYKVYRPVRRSMLEDAEGVRVVSSPLSKLKAALFPTDEERSRLLTGRRV